ncbi:MAG: phosphate/phosphite/phosphonate ABC transporter substrate-binding protein [Nocardioides sp.]
MFGQKISVVATMAALSVLAACGGDNGSSGSAGEEEASDPDTLVLGLVPSGEVDKLVEDADVLGELLSEELDMPVETRVTENYAGLVVAMQTDQAQIGMFGPVALVQAVDQAGAKVVLQSVRFGASTYHTQWFTNDPETYCSDEPVLVEDEGVNYSYCNGTDSADTGPVADEALANVEEGTTISFVDQSSASGYYYPATQLQQASGLDPLTDIDAQFAGDHDNSVLSVARGDVPVGVSFDDARTGLVEDDPQIGEKVTVFAYSTEIPNDGVAVSGSLSEELQQQITDAFLALTETEEGLAALAAVYEIEDLVPADLDALDAARQVAEKFGE